MTINPLLFSTSIKVGIITVLLISIFFFSKAYQANSKVFLKSKVRTAGVSLALHKDNLTSRFSPGPFMIKILKALALISITSLVISLYSDFQNIKITFSLWLRKTPTKISLNLLYDQYFLVFLRVALLVT